jgi:hypothetical protein
MKTSRLLITLVFAMCLSLTAHANIGQTKNLNASGSSVICVPGYDDQIIVIQNNGSNSVRLSFDGGAGYVPPTGGKAGTNPTPTTGYLLAAGQQIILSTPPYVSSPSYPGLHKPIVAIMVTGTTTIDIITDGVLTQFPTT